MLQAMSRSILRRGLGSRQRAVLAVLLLAVQPPKPARYAAELLSCAAYRERIRTAIHTEAGAVTRDETAGREGLLFVQGMAGIGGRVSIEAWYDSLSVWREGPEGRITPDPEGLLGGRWRGSLSADGAYASDAVPFVPDEVAEIADLRGVMEDFFPRLPAKPLRDGERFEWTRSSPTDTTMLSTDTLSVPMRRETSEQGSLVWNHGRGPLRWERALTIVLSIASGGGSARRVRSTITQRIEVSRSDRPGGCTTGQSGPS